MPSIFVDESKGSDSPDSLGTESSPWKTLQAAYVKHGADVEYQIRKPAEEGEQAGEDGMVWKAAAKTALKKAANFAESQRKKAQGAQKQAEHKAREDAEREAVLERAKAIKITEDDSLPSAVRIRLDETDAKKIGTLRKSKEQDTPPCRIRVFGRVHRERKQKGLVFITLRDGYGLMQVVLSGQLAKTYDALTLTRETSMEITGELMELPEGAHAPLGRELQADYYVIHPGWKAVGGDDAITNRVAATADAQTLLNDRHLTLRGEKATSVMLVRDAVEYAFHQTYRELRCRKVSPPALVQTQVEGGASLFKFDYYGQESYLTQSSQLYLETCLPSLGDVYCIEKSFRAEKSLTRRHLSEYTHVEAELDYITFDDLLSHLEEVICRVIDLTLADPAASKAIKDLHPEFKPPSRPFMRMRYTDAIDWLRAHDVKNEDGNEHTFGDDIAEAAERKMTDEINKPIFLTHFPAEIKSFYMQKAADDRRTTESVDCLMPGVGEIVGGSMRMWDYEELMEAYTREGIDPAPYYWYSDQRRYGSSPHGGYGLGLERFLAWMCGLWTVREACLYPRYMGRCTP